MLKGLTAQYVKISSGYMGQLLEWPEVITEGVDREDCRKSLEDAAREMILAYRQMDKEIPVEHFDRITANELCKQAGLGKQF